MDNRERETNTEIDNLLGGIKERDIRFFRIDELKRNVERVERFSNKCAICESLKAEISEMTPQVRKAVEYPGKERRRLDKLESALATHMKKEHGFFPPWHFNYLYSFWGIVAGIAVGAILYLTIQEKQLVVPVFCFAIGLLAGQLLGSSKDRKIRREKKLM